MQKKKPIHANVPDEYNEPVMVEEIAEGGQANVTMFTPGGRGYGQEESLSLQGAPQHPDMAGGDGMHMGGEGVGVISEECRSVTVWCRCEQCNNHMDA